MTKLSIKTLTTTAYELFEIALSIRGIYKRVKGNKKLAAEVKEHLFQFIIEGLDQVVDDFDTLLNDIEGEVEAAEEKTKEPSA